MIFNTCFKKWRFFHIPKETYGLDGWQDNRKENRSNQFSCLKIEGPGLGLGNLEFPICPSAIGSSASQLKRPLTCVKETAFATQKWLSLLHGDLSLSQDLQRKFLSRHAFLQWGLFWWSEKKACEAVRTVGLLSPQFFRNWLALGRACGHTPPPLLTHHMPGFQGF